MKLIIICVAVLLGVGTFLGFNAISQPASVPQGDDTSVGEAKLTDDIESVSEATVLDMSNKGLTQVPSDIFTYETLQVLNLSHNNLTGALPAEVRHLQVLTELDISYNNFTGVPAEVGQLEQLEILNLSHTEITGMPYELANLEKLKILDLRGTPYAEVDLAVIRKGLPANVQILVD